MGASQNLTSLSCELKIIQARNLELKSTGNIFVRFYLSSGNNKMVELNTKEMPSNSNFHLWNESFSLECQGTEDSVNALKQERIVFELRWRKRGSILGKLCKSELLGRGEVSWESVFGSNMEVERWVEIVLANDRVVGGVKPPMLQVAVKVRVLEMVEKEMKKKKRVSTEDRCGCRDGAGFSCVDYEAIAFVAALEAL